MTTINGTPPQSPAYWSGALAAAIAWYLAHGDRKGLQTALEDYSKRGASAEVRQHLEAIWKGKKK